MEEDTSTGQGSEQAPAAVEADSETPAAETASQTPETSAPAADQASDPGKTPGPHSEGIDPQLIVLCLILWVVAAGIVFSRWESLKIDWYLGNIKTVLGPLPQTGTAAEAQMPQLDEDSIKALVDMAGDAEVVPALRKELDNRAQLDQRYRVVMIDIAKRIGDEQALAFIADRGSIDYDYRVRANSYLALIQRGPSAAPELRERSLQVLQRALDQEVEQIARSIAASGLGEFGDDRVAWDLIKALRDAEGPIREGVRVACLKSLRTLSKKDERELPFDVAAEGQAFDAQVKAWEAWFVEAVGPIPAGESLDEVRAAEAAAAEATDAEDGQSSDGSTDDPTASPDDEAKPE